MHAEKPVLYQSSLAIDLSDHASSPVAVQIIISKVLHSAMSSSIAQIFKSFLAAVPGQFWFRVMKNHCPIHELYKTMRLYDVYL